MKDMYLKLVDAAIEGRNNSYSPYSKFKVGAAALLKDGTIIRGCNIENISYGLSCCAERNTIFSLICQGYKCEDIVAFAVVGDTKEPISPCGACRQVMAEFFKKDMPIILANLNKDIKVTNIVELLPYSFEEIENV